ncbi:MAG TPA: thioether cross-link-forming SCIFF peptide maturase [Candidatus Enterenecus merdae]|nr:thioether cross-link-forming SCIFF peptide maturase [Candidatus Enterenecus merdae]
MVHTFQCLGVFLAVDVYSGAVHILDETAYDLLNLLDGPLPEGDCPAWVLEQLSGHGAQAVQGAWEELQALTRQGLLFTDDSYLDPAAAALLQKEAPIKALCLHVSHDCNLRCEYCFASTGDFGTGKRVTMDVATAKKAIDFVIQRSGKRRNIEVDFFGGEPLMAMDTVKATVDYARSLEEKYDKSFRFTITTNGVLLNDETIEYINREMSNAVLSLDGRPEVNDAMRKTAADTGSYEVILPKFQKLVAGRGEKDYYLRGTFTRHNRDFAADVLHIADQGFRHVSVEPVVGSPEQDYTFREEDLPGLLQEYENLAEQLLDRDDVNFFHFHVDLSQGPCVIKRVRGCGAGCEYVAVTPDGDIYPCHQFVGNEDYRLGNVWDGSFNMDLSHRFADLNIYSRPDCQTCWAKFYCSGGCSASNLQTNGDIKQPNEFGCQLQRKRLECAIAMQARRSMAQKAK